MSKAATAAPAKEDRVIINVAFSKDNEPRRIFVGANGLDVQIERGKDVTVPRAVLAALDEAVIGVPEVDENDPDKVIFVERKRFPYTIVGTVAA